MDDEEVVRQLIDAANRFTLRGWDFSVLSGRTTSQPLPWDYLRLARDAAARADRVLDVDTGGGEIYASITPPAGSIAVEPHAPNLAVARAALAPHHIEVRERVSERLPAAGGEVDLVLNRHGAFDPHETFRVLRGGGTLLAQLVGRNNDAELNDAFGVPASDSTGPLSVSATVGAVTGAGFEVERCEEAWPRTDYLDVGALVLQLRAVPWQIPGFDVGENAEQLRRLHDHIRRHGSFAVTSHRLLLIGRRP